MRCAFEKFWLLRRADPCSLQMPLYDLCYMFANVHTGTRTTSFTTFCASPQSVPNTVAIKLFSSFSSVIRNSWAICFIQFADPEYSRSKAQTFGRRQCGFFEWFATRWQSPWHNFRPRLRQGSVQGLFLRRRLQVRLLTSSKWFFHLTVISNTATCLDCSHPKTFH